MDDIGKPPPTAAKSVVRRSLERLVQAFTPGFLDSLWKVYRHYYSHILLSNLASR